MPSVFFVAVDLVLAAHLHGALNFVSQSSPRTLSQSLQQGLLMYLSLGFIRRRRVFRAGCRRKVRERSVHAILVRVDISGPSRLSRNACTLSTSVLHFLFHISDAQF